MENSKIEWCDHTHNEWEGCTHISPGCKNCYAEQRAKRFNTVEWGKGKLRRQTSIKTRNQVYKWNTRLEGTGKKEIVFVNSLSDWADDDVPNGWRDELFQRINECRNLNFLLLTKRPKDAIAYFKSRILSLEKFDFDVKKFKNIMLGVSICTQKEADEKIPVLLEIKNLTGCKIFLSMEPLIEKVDVYDKMTILPCEYCGAFDGEVGRCYCGITQNAMIDWVIVGGESGHNARPINPEWVRLIRDQCHEYKVPFFFKQWGEWIPENQIDKTVISMQYIKMLKSNSNIGYFKDELERYCKLGKKHSGNILDGKQYLEFPEGLK